MEWKDYFFFTRRERRGTLMLMVLIVLLSVVKYGSSYAVAKDEAKNALIANQIAQFDSLRLEENQPKVLPQSEVVLKKPVKVKPQSVSSYIKPQRVYSYVSNKTDKVVELNAADTTLLKQLRGIGSVYAKRIIKFRTYLGGFYSPDQLKEVYGFKVESFNKIKAQLSVDTTKIVQLQVNKLGIDSLKRHPYIRYYQAKIIYDLRMKNKDKQLHSFDEIDKNNDLTSVFKRKIKAYLSFE